MQFINVRISRTDASQKHHETILRIYNIVTV